MPRHPEDRVATDHHVERRMTQILHRAGSVATRLGALTDPLIRNYGASVAIASQHPGDAEAT